MEWKKARALQAKRLCPVPLSTRTFFRSPEFRTKQTPVLSHSTNNTVTQENVGGKDLKLTLVGFHSPSLQANPHQASIALIIPPT
jgi:hypothetical protein